MNKKLRYLKSTLAILVISVAAFTSGCMIILPTSSISTNQKPEKVAEREILTNLGTNVDAQHNIGR